MEIHRGAFLGSHWCVLKMAGELLHFLEGCLCEIIPSSRDKKVAIKKWLCLLKIPALLPQSPRAESKLEPLMLCLLGAYSDPPLFSNTPDFVATLNMAFQ